MNTLILTLVLLAYALPYLIVGVLLFVVIRLLWRWGND
jgi:hypothetical protein